MDTVFKFLFFREPIIRYVCPPVCENLFSSSGGPVIILNDLDRLTSISGLVSGGVGGVFLRWGIYPGALCYSVYMAEDPNNPLGSYVIIAECIPNPEFNVDPFGSGYYIVTAITPDGETPFSDPVQVVKIPTACPSITADPAEMTVNANEGDNVVLGPFTVNEGAGLGQVIYQWFKDSIYLTDTTLSSKASLALTSVTESDAGDYTLRLTNDDPGCTLTSDPITLTVAVVGCPEETGTPTPAALMQPDPVDYGNFTTIFPGGGQQSLGAYDPGKYTITYLGGVWHNEDNPCPWTLSGDWKFFGIDVKYNDSATSVPWIADLSTVCASTEASTEAAVLAERTTLQMNHTGGTMALGASDAGTDPVAGGSYGAPTFQLQKTHSFPTVPERLRVASFDASEFDVTGCGLPVSADPAWDGTCPDALIFPGSDSYDWASTSGDLSINGRLISGVSIRYESSGNPHNVTGAGWFMEIYRVNFPFGATIVWKGWRSVGTTPAGRFYRDGGCAPGPECLTIEAY